MIKIGFIIAKIRYKIHGNKHEIVNKYFRKRGATIGSNVVVCSNLDLCNEELLFIGDRVVISTGVTFVTHDFSISRAIKDSPDLWGKIIIGNNCFIGENSTILYGVELADDIIVGAGSVVTKSFLRGGVVIAGNPAKIICSVSDFAKKYSGRGIYGNEILDAVRNDDWRLIRRKDGTTD